jgi:uncharacterized membrane protein
MMILLRIIHILAGIFWVGSVMFIALFLEPSISAAGPAGGQVIKEITKRNYSRAAAASGLLTVLAGLTLFWIDSDHFRSKVWLQSGSGRTYQLGATLAIIGLIIGITIVRPTVEKLGALAASASPGNPPPAAEMAPLQHKLHIASRWVAVLLGLAAVAMAAARYL